MIKLICINFEGGIIMAKNISSKKTNFANNRPNCLKVTKKRQGVNLQKVQVKDENGKVVYAEGYVGFKGIFDLPMDENKADPKAAEELLGNY